MSGVRWKEEWKSLALVAAVFLGCYYLPVGWSRFDGAVLEAFRLVKWYAQEHALLCLVPAFFIAGAIAVFVGRASVMKYLGPKANKVLAYGVASVSGTILAVCSCTVLPLFAGIYRMGAGLGPASAFLYSGPAINILAIVLTARVLGTELGFARAVGAVLFSVIIGLAMHFIFRGEELEKAGSLIAAPEPETGRPLWQNALYFASMAAILVFSNWGKPDESTGIWHLIYSVRWRITGISAIAFAVMLVSWFGLKRRSVLLACVPVAMLSFLFPDKPTLAFVAGVIGLSVIISRRKDETGEWFAQTWGFVKQILPLLLFGVFIAGALLGRPGQEGLIPSTWISKAVGGNTLLSNFFAAFAGAFMYFATLTEIPILEGLIGNGMGRGPALSLLLAGPALSLPNMLVIHKVMGTRKTVVFVLLVVIISATGGIVFGAISGK